MNQQKKSKLFHRQMVKLKQMVRLMLRPKKKKFPLKIKNIKLVEVAVHHDHILQKINIQRIHLQAHDINHLHLINHTNHQAVLAPVDINLHHLVAKNHVIHHHLKQPVVGAVVINPRRKNPLKKKHLKFILKQKFR